MELGQNKKSQNVRFFLFKALSSIEPIQTDTYTIKLFLSHITPVKYEATNMARSGFLACYALNSANQTCSEQLNPFGVRYRNIFLSFNGR